MTWNDNEIHIRDRNGKMLKKKKMSLFQKNWFAIKMEHLRGDVEMCKPFMVKTVGL